MPEDGHNKEVDEEGDRQGNGGLDQEVHVGFSDISPAGPVYLSGLYRSKRREAPKSPRTTPTPSALILLPVFSPEPQRFPKPPYTAVWDRPWREDPSPTHSVYFSSKPLLRIFPPLRISSPLIFLPIPHVSAVNSLERPFLTTFSKVALSLVILSVVFPFRAPCTVHDSFLY